MGTGALFFGIVAIVAAVIGTPFLFAFMHVISIPSGLLAIGLAVKQLGRSGWRKWNQQDPESPYAVSYAWRGLALGVLALGWAALVITRDYGPPLRDYFRHY